MLQALHPTADFSRLQPDEVHVWCVPLSSNIGNAETLGALLSRDECEKAGRFVFERDKIRYVAARGILRRLLGGYLNIDPAEIRFSYGASGKPELTGRLTERLRFNLSHAGDWAVYAISGDREVGIDIEPLRTDIPWQQLAPLVFSSNEQAEFAEIPMHEKAAAFLRGWTRKEAYLKGRGEGLSLSLDAFDVPLRSLEDRDSVCIRNASGRSSGWRLYPLELIHGFASALAVEGAQVRITVCHWSGLAVIQSANRAVFRSSEFRPLAFSYTADPVGKSTDTGLVGKDLCNRLDGIWPN
ncbi:4'-phosphopantetheinyl transferase family protein [Methylocaldum sp. MU1018]